MNPAWVICLALLIAGTAQRGAQASQEPPPEVVALVEKLPDCSSLRQEMRQGQFGDGIERPYTQAMRDSGVQRAYFEFEGAWRHGHADRIRIVRRLYYRQLDGPDAQITNPATLIQIARSGLEARLDQAVQEQAQTAVLYAGIDRWAVLGVTDKWRWQVRGSRIYGQVDLFFSPWVRLRSAPNFVFPSEYRNDLPHAARVGDVMDVAKLLSAQKHSQQELNQSLGEAGMSSWDNAGAIDLLIKAGADVNARLGDGMTPLMLTYSSPCNMAVLLAHGARAEDRNRWGKTALDLAQERHDTIAVRILEAAGAKP